MNALLAFMRERELIRHRKEAGSPGPWTQDPILQRYRFCNVHREHDRVTVWIRQQWREPFADHPNLWIAMALARLINWPATLQAIGFPEQYDARYVDNAIHVMRARAAAGDKVYTGAYMVRGDIQGGYADKPPYTFHKVLSPLVKGLTRYMSDLENVPRASRSLEATHAQFLPYHGWGGFLAYEVVTDLRWTRYLQGAHDINHWAYAGPGAVRGLNRLAGRPVGRAMAPEEALKEMQQVLQYLQLVAGWHGLEMRDVEHSLCEFDKYERARLGEGRPRTTYVPGRGF